MGRSVLYSGCRCGLFRTGLALFRVLALFFLLIWLLFQIDLQVRFLHENGFNLNAVDTTSIDLPFVGTTVTLESINSTLHQAFLARLAESNVGWVRQRFDWGKLEPSAGDFDWTQSDQILTAIDDAGLVPVVVLDGSPAWARADIDLGATDNPFAPPADPLTFADFAAAFAHRYGDQVRYYQIWHEPNIAPHWGNRHVEPVQYAQLLIEASRAIRAVDEDAIILTAALAPTMDRGHTAIDEVTFLYRLYATGVRSHIDAVAIEPLGFGHRATDTRNQRDLLNFQRAAWVRRAMVAAGDGETPILIARYGWNLQLASPWRTVTPDEQQRFLADALEIGWSDWPWLAGMGWAIDQPMSEGQAPMSGFTLNDELLAVVRHWGGSEPGSREGPTTQWLWLWPVMFGTVAVVLWRGWAATQLLPWQAWRDGYLRQPVWLRAGLWIALLLLYYFAVWPPFILLCIAIAMVLVAMQPPVGVWLAALLLPFTFQHKEIHLVSTTLLITPVQILVLASLPALAIRFISSRTRVPLQPLDWFGFGWLALSLWAGLNVWHWPGYIDGLIDLVITPLLLYILLRFFIVDRAQRLYTGLALFAGGLVVAVLGLIDWLLGGGTEVDAVRRLVGPYFSPNHAALYLERTFFLGLGLWLIQRDRPQSWRSHGRPSWVVPFALTSAIVAVMLALVLTASRGALLLGVPAGLLFFIGYTANGQIRRSGRLGWTLAIASLMVCAIALAFWPRLSNTATVTERLDIWMATLRLWQEMPLVGAGPGGFYWHYPTFIPVDTLLDPNLRHPHNVWLETMAMWGIVGMVWLLGLLIWVGRRCWVERVVFRDCLDSGIAIGLMAALLAGLAHGQVDAFNTLADIAGWNWLALGLWRAVVWPCVLRQSS